jgi:hypothetical protein
LHHPRLLRNTIFKNADRFIDGKHPVHYQLLSTTSRYTPSGEIANHTRKQWSTASSAEYNSSISSVTPIQGIQCRHHRSRYTLLSQDVDLRYSQTKYANIQTAIINPGVPTSAVANRDKKRKATSTNKSNCSSRTQTTTSAS